MAAEIIIPLSFFAMILGIIYLSYRKKERMALIQHGLDASVFGNNDKCYSTLKWGLLTTGVGLGLLIAELIAKYELMTPEIAYFSMAFIFSGLALIIDFIIEFLRHPKNKN